MCKLKSIFFRLHFIYIYIFFQNYHYPKYKDGNPTSEKSMRSLASIKEKCMRYIKSDPELLRKVREWTALDRGSVSVKRKKDKATGGIYIYFFKIIYNFLLYSLNI